MLIELSIENLALIERAALHFGHGLNVITGETGAGKSLLIDALELLMGQRGRSGLVRKGESRACVEGRFLLERGGYGEHVRAWLAEHLPQALADQEDEDLEVILTRTLTRDGRTRAHVNHRPVTQRVQRELAAQLVEIHGQNDHQKLFEPVEQMRLIDDFGKHGDSLAGYAERRARWRGLAERLENFEQGEAERLQRLDLLRFQAKELGDANLSPEEREALVRERGVLRHAGELGETIGTTAFELAEADDSALDVLRRAERAFEEWEARVPELQVPGEEVRQAAFHLEEAARGLAHFLSGVEVDPVRLEVLEERLSVLEGLERKYRTDLAGLIERLHSIEEECDALEARGAGQDELAAETSAARTALEEAAERLSSARSKLTQRLEKAVHKGLRELGLERAEFEVGLARRGPVGGTALAQERERFGPHGIDTVEFRLAANPGESRDPLRRVASGGEMARIMLALRGALAVRQSTPTLVFDEVDAGVGGRLGPEVGAHLAALGSHHQVLCVTHLPAIAAVAASHLRVHKEVDQGRTRTLVAELAGEARVEEIADMIAGGAAHATARAEAERLLAGD